MSITVNDYLKKAIFVRDNILNVTEDIVYKNEAAIIRMNTSQFENGLGSDDATLKNSNDKYTGRYSFYTSLLTPSKQAGELYDFNMTGAFLSGMEVNVLPDVTKLYIDSTGTGRANSDKAAFFKGYNNLFGLNKNNTLILNLEIIYPELMDFIKKYL